MTFRCNGLRVDRDKLETKEDRAAKHIRSVLNLTYAEVENYLNSYREDDYKVRLSSFREQSVVFGCRSFHSVLILGSIHKV